MSSSSPGADWRSAFDEFAGRRVLVSGASSGIGAAVARAFAECGASVCIHYGRQQAAAESAAAGLRARGFAASTVGADLARAGAAAGMVSRAVAALGGLDVLISVAGSPFGRARMEAIGDEACATIVQVNLRAVVDSIRAALPALRQATHAAIVNTSSVAVRTGGGRGVALYAAAKAGVESLTRSLSRELAADGIRVNCVAPGYIATPIHDDFSTDEDRAAYVAATPMQRAGTADECVGAYLFLASHRLSSFVTGQTIAINGGLAFG